MDVEYIEDVEQIENINNRITVNNSNEQIDLPNLNPDVPLLDSNGKIYITNTKNIKLDNLEIVSPEEIQTSHEKEAMINPNTEFTSAIKNIENQYQRNLTRDEYIKACDSYATILAERDEEKKSSLQGKYNINPIKKAKYFEMLLDNRPVTNALKELMNDYEKSMISPIVEAYNKNQESETKILEIKNNKRINAHYKGKCRIASDESGKIIVIDAKKDVDLLHMKYRKEWLEKKYPDINNPIQIRDDDEEFV